MSRTRIKVLITARNVVNADEIRNKLIDISDGAVYKKGKNWVLNNVYSYLINDFVSGREVKPLDSIKDLIKVFKGQSNVPSWATAALEKGEALYYISPNAPFWRNLSHIIDYLNTQDKDWSRVSFPQMETLIKAWDKELKNQKVIDSSKSNFKFFMDSGPYQWVKILNAEGLKDEGSRMGHCVGGAEYARKLKAGKIEIYSLRDKNFTNPHVTIEVNIKENPPRIKQIQGKQNTVQTKYSSNVVDFLRKAGFQIYGELLNEWELIQSGPSNTSVRLMTPREKQDQEILNRQIERRQNEYERQRLENRDPRTLRPGEAIELERLRRDSNLVWW